MTEPGTDPPTTGDAQVDQVLQDLDEGLLGEGTAQLEALIQAHRRLQNRLTGEQPVVPADPPGRARPGPR